MRYLETEKLASLDAEQFRSLELRLHWYYTPAGCSVSHPTAMPSENSDRTSSTSRPSGPGRRLGRRNPPLDDGGRFESDSAPRFEDFDAVTTPETMDNRSLLFARRGDSWHGVRGLRYPADRLGRVFIVTVEKPSLGERLWSAARGAA